MSMVRTEYLGGKPFCYRINGKQYFFDRIRFINELNNHMWGGQTLSGVSFKVEGGKKAGGSARDWFLDVEGWKGSIHCTSLVDALRTINNA